MSVTPPPLPPKSPSLAPSIRTMRSMRSTNTYSSYTTENPVSPGRPTHAQRGTRTTASSIHLSHPDQLLDLVLATGSQLTPPVPTDEDRGRDDRRIDLEQEIANLPWAQPPPRDPSPLPIHLQRQPSFSFISSDPAQQASSSGEGVTISRRSSRSSVSSRRSQNIPQPWSASTPATYLSPSLDHSHDQHQQPQRHSFQTMNSYQSGMADMGTLEEMGGPSRRTLGYLHESHISDMAARAPSSLSNRSDKSLKTRIVKSLKSRNSSKSTASTRKRISASTIHRRSFQHKYGKWEVEMSPLLEEDLRRREESLELTALMGRATVLERMLRAGQRISGASPIVPSLRRLASRSTKTPSRPSTSDTVPTPNSIRSPSMRSFRRQFSRRIKRDDEFTDIDSQSGFGSTLVDIVLVEENPQARQPEKEKNWVILVPGPEEMDQDKPPVLQTKGRMPTCMTFHPCGDQEDKSPPRPQGSEEGDEVPDTFRQSPHLGHRDPDYHQRQSVMTYISVGKWSSSTRGGRRRRRLAMGISIGCVVGVILLTGLLAGLLARRG